MKGRESNTFTAEPMEQFSEFILNTHYEDLPSEVVDHIKKLFLDTLGITIGGSSQKSIPEIVDLVKSWGGAQQSTILVYGGKVPTPNAAFAIGPMTRALDMGDTHPQACHISEYVVPALLPASELKGNVSGKEFITAYAVAAEIGSRLGNACQSMGKALDIGRHPQFGIFEVTAAVGKLFGLDKATMQNALGIAYHLITARDMQMYSEGTLMVRGHHSFMCQNAINAVLFAQRGITGAHKVFTGEQGLFVLDYSWESTFEPLTKELSTTWELLKDSIKLYASCRCNHSPVSGAAALVKENKINLADVEEIMIEVDPGCKKTVCEPAPMRWDPKTIVEAQFSLPFAVSNVIVKGKIFLDDYTPTELQNQKVRSLMTKVKCTVDETFKGFESNVSILLKSRKKYTKRTTIDEIKGGFQNPINWDEVVEKFKLNLPFSAVKLSKGKIDELIEKCKTLETLSDMSEIIDLCTP